MYTDELLESTLLNILEPVDYSLPLLRGEDQLLDFLDDVISNKRKVLLYGDYDVDGLMGLLIWREWARDFDANYTCYGYSKRTHNLDSGAIKKAITENYEAIIITDTGTSPDDLQNIKLLVETGVRVLVIDHHATSLTYEDFPNEVVVVSSYLDTGANLTVSGAAMAFVCAAKWYQVMGRQLPDALPCYALVSMYSDVIDMNSDFGRKLYEQVSLLSYSDYPRVIRQFISQYDILNKRFVTFMYAPKINALFRSEEFGLINKYFLQTESSSFGVELLTIIDNVYTTSRDMVSTIVDIAPYKEYNNIVLVNISGLGSVVHGLKYPWNYTGVVASKISDQYNKACLTYAMSDTGAVKCSLRDNQGRDFLSLFRLFSDANGHKPAFGITVPARNFDEFLRKVQQVDTLLTGNKDYFSNQSPSKVKLFYNIAEPDKELMDKIAFYNEFAGDSLPVLVVEKTWLKSEYKYTGYYHMYKWGNMWLKSNRPLVSGSVLEILPVQRRSTELRVQDVIPY